MVLVARQNIYKYLRVTSVYWKSKEKNVVKYFAMFHVMANGVCDKNIIRLKRNLEVLNH